jgi:hypothetical protein
MLKQMFEDAIAEIVEGFGEGLRFMWAFITAPFVVWMEFVTNTGRWAPRDGGSRSDLDSDRTGA